MQQPCNVIYLDPEFQKVYLEHKVELNDDNRSLKFYWNKYQEPQLGKPICCYCGVYYNQIPESIWKICEDYHFYCDFCFRFSSERYTNKCAIDGFYLIGNANKRLFIDNRLPDMLKEILYECKWPKCENIYNGICLKEHEMSCKLQPARECPVNGCTWKGPLKKMQVEHFKECHLHKELSFENVVIPSPILNDYYILILDVFVLVCYEMKQLGQVYGHNITLKVCKDELGCAQPMAVVSHESKNTYAVLGNIQGHGVIKSIRSDIALLVYFQQPNP